MNTLKRTRTLVLGIGLFVVGVGQAQVTTLGNNSNLGDYVGCDGTSPFPLEIRQNDNYPIQWYTDATRRMRLHETLTGQTIGIYTNEDLSGNLGVGAFTTTNVPRPFSLLHLDNGGNQYSGYRPWHRPGMTITNGTDLGWIGLKNEGNDHNHFTLAWADNTTTDGPDLFKVIFLANPSTTGTAGTLNGLETMRILPKASGLESYVGIGDWNSAAANPNERLDVLDGRVRIRQLPTDPVSTSEEVVTVNMSSGVLEHRPIASLPDNCEWTQINGGSFDDDVVTALGTDPGCPDKDNSVGIGTNQASAKLHVVTNEVTDGSPAEGIRVLAKGDASGSTAGIIVNVEADSSNGADHIAVNATATNATTRNVGVEGTSVMSGTISGLQSIGVSGRSSCSHGSGTVSRAYAFYGDAVRNGGGTVSANYAYYGRAIGGIEDYGGYGLAQGGSSTLNTHGFYGAASGAKNLGSNYALRGVATSVSGTTAYGVHARASGAGSD